MRKVQNRSFLGNSLFKKMLGAFALAILVILAYPQMEAQAKTTITVKSVNQATAKKVHKQLMKGKEFDIRIPGNEQNFYSKFQKLTKKVAKCTDYGFDIYPICYAGYGSNKPTQSGGYTTLVIKKNYCEEYIYGIKYAKREYKAFKAYVDKALKSSEKLYKALNNGTGFPNETKYKDKKTLTTMTKKTVKQLKELQKYLKKTKFRNLSGAMKARVALGFGEIFKRQWGKASMKYNHNNHTSSQSFKALYSRKAYGVCSAYAKVACKIAAVFSIGEFDYLDGVIYDEGHAVARVKVRTLGGKSRYVIISNGTFGPYNNYIGLKVRESGATYRTPNWQRDGCALGKIKENQQMKEFKLMDEEYGAKLLINGNVKSTPTYKFTFSKSEW